MPQMFVTEFNAFELAVGELAPFARLFGALLNGVEAVFGSLRVLLELRHRRLPAGDLLVDRRLDLRIARRAALRLEASAAVSAIDERTFLAW